MMPVFRHWALVAVYYDSEADDLELADEQIKHMSVMDWHCEGIVNTMIQVQVGTDKEGHPEFQTITTEQLTLFGEEATYGRRGHIPDSRRKRHRR
jgi:hypothetical protein